MKKTLLVILIAFTCFNVKANPTVIHFWHFNNLTTAYHNPNIPDIKADYSIIDTNKALIAYKLLPGTSSNYAGYIDNVTGTDTNSRLGITASGSANHAYRFRNPSDSAYMQIYIPTNGYQNIALSYVLESSSTTSGQLVQHFDYSVDSGATWTTTGLNIDTLDVSQSKYQGSNWGMVSINFANDTAHTNNNSALVFRIKFSGNTSGTSGNNRFDNLVVEGDSITTTTTAVNTIITNKTAFLYPNPVQNELNLSLGQGTKTIQVFNTSGQVLNTLNTQDEKVALNVNDYAAGQYFITIKKEGNIIQTLKFIKQ